MAVQARSRRGKKRVLAYDDFNGTALRTTADGWTKTDSESKITVAGGGMSFAPKAAPAYDDPRATLQKRILPYRGLTVETAITWTSFGAQVDGLSYGFDGTNPVASYARPGFAVRNDGTLVVVQHSDASYTKLPITLVVGTEYRFRVVYNDTGTAYLVSLDAGKTWIVVWVDRAAVTYTNPVWPGFTNNGMTFTVWYVKVFKGPTIPVALSDAFASRTSPGKADTGQQWLSVSGFSTPLLTSNDLRIPVGGTLVLAFAYDGFADGIWEGDLNFGSAPSTIKQSAIYIRFRDGSNYVRALFNRVAQTITIQRATNGVLATLGTLSSAAFADNTTYTMRVVAVGTTIKVYQGGVEKLSVVEAAMQYAALCALFVNDNLATPDSRWDNFRAWGFPHRAMLLDTFDRPDENPMTHGPDVGKPYAFISSGSVSPSTFRVGSGRASAVSVAGDGTLGPGAIAPLSALAHVTQFTARRSSAGGSSLTSGAFIRYQDKDNWMLVRALYDTSQLSILQSVAGVLGAVLTVGSITYANDTDYVITVVSSGTTIDVYVDGIRKMQASGITNFAAYPYVGAYSTTDPNATVDNLASWPLVSPISIHDTFTRVDSATTPGNTETPGSPWTVFAGTMGISSNRAYSVTDADGDGDTVPFLPPDFAIESIVNGTLNSATVYRTPGLLLNRNADGSGLRLRLLNGAIDLVKRTAGGVDTVLGTAATATANATDYTLRAEVVNKSVKCMKDGATLMTVVLSDADYAAYLGSGLKNVGKRLGKAGAPATAARWDNFKVTELA